MADSSTPQVFAYDPLNKAEVTALQALSKGEADPHQQQLALKVIVNKISRSHDQLYLPTSFSDTAFLNGRAFVGQKIMMHLGIAISKLELAPLTDTEPHHGRPRR